MKGDIQEGEETLMSEGYPNGHLPSRSESHGKKKHVKEHQSRRREEKWSLVGRRIGKSSQQSLAKRSLLGLLVILALFLIFLGYKAFSNYRSTQKPIDITQIREQALNVKKAQPFTVLILGVDNGVEGRLTDGGRSDTMILATVNPKQGRTSLLSIPRDSYTEIVGHGTQDKINHAYAFGGAKMSVETVQKMLNVPIDYYVEVNMQGLKDVVNAVGGVEVVSPLTFEYDGAKFKKHKRYHLKGWEALAFTRMRKEDPRGDYGRQERQRLVIEGLVKKLKHVSSVGRINSLLDVMGKNFRTNLTVTDLLNIQKHYQPATKKFQTWGIEGREMWLDQIFYFYMEPKELLKFSNRIRRELYMEEITLADIQKVDVDKSAIGGKVDAYQQNEIDAQQPQLTYPAEGGSGGASTSPETNETGGGQEGNSTPPATSEESGTNESDGGSAPAENGGNATNESGSNEESGGE